MKQTTYIVHTRYVCTGHFIVKAYSKKQAHEYVQKHCGLVLVGSIHSNLDTDVVDWEFTTHPTCIIDDIKKTHHE